MMPEQNRSKTYHREDLVALLVHLTSARKEAFEGRMDTELMNALFEAIIQRMNAKDCPGSFHDPLLDALRDLNRFLGPWSLESEGVELREQALRSTWRAFCQDETF